MSSSFNFFSHPDMKLDEHLLNVAKLSEEILIKSNFKSNIYLSKVSFIIGLSHDFAKSTSFFQNYLFDNSKRTEKAHHGFLSAVFAYYNIKKYLHKHSNIESDSLIFDVNLLPAISYLIVLRHHGNLKSLKGDNKEIDNLKNNFNKIEVQINDLKKQNLQELNEFYMKYEIDIYDFINIYSDLKKQIRNDLKKLFISNGISNYLILLFLYSVLLDGDKLDASKTNPPSRREIYHDIVDRYKRDKFNDRSRINEIRERSYNEVIDQINNFDFKKDRIFSLELPTGCGKTLTAFSFSLKLRERINEMYGFTPRIIYSLPFLSIIDQNEDVIRNILEYFKLQGSDFLLKHNYMSDMNYKTDDADFNQNSSQLLTEGWYSEIIITTFIQMFYSLISNKNRSIRKFHNISNSIILLDEIQSIPYKFWPIINSILKEISYKFNSWVILITATQPLIFKNEEIKPLIKRKEDYFEEFNRIRFNFDLDNKPFNEFKKEANDSIKANPDKNIMFIMNTINTSKELYDHIKENLEDNEEPKIDSNGIVNTSGSDLIFLSTNIIPKHRMNRINHIKNSKNRKIIVTTQLIEAGVDISVDIIYRDLAPLDSIIQTGGRCNRNYSQDLGEVNIINLVNEKNKSFGSFVYNNILLQSTKKIITTKKEIYEKDFINFPEKYYKELLEYGSQDESSKLFDILNKLKFSEIEYNFRILDNKNIPKIDVFVNIDKESNSIWEEFSLIAEEKGNQKRKAKFLTIKNRFYKYVISVSTKKIGRTEIHNEWLGFIDKNHLNEKYDMETGFINAKEEEPFII